MKTIAIAIDAGGRLNLSDTLLGMMGEHNNTKLVISSPDGFLEGADYFRMCFGSFESTELSPVDGVIEYLVPSAVTDATMKSWQLSGYQLGDSGVSLIKKTQVASFYLRPSVEAEFSGAAELADSIETDIARMEVLVQSAEQTVAAMQEQFGTAAARFVDKVSGKGLSTNDYTNDDKAKVDAISTEISASVADKANKTQVDLWIEDNQTETALIAENAANKAMASAGVIPYTAESCFSITAGGEVSLAPAYRGPVASSTESQWSDKGKGIAGSLFSSLPSIINIPQTIGGVTVTSLASYGFAYISAQKIYMPDTVTAFGGQVFAMASSLQRCYFSNQLTVTGEQVFYSCTALDRVVLPPKLTVLPKSFFYKCSALSAVVVGQSITSLGQWSFRGTALQEITLPSGLTEIGQAAFWQCYNLETVNFKGTGLQSMAQTAFGYCTALKNLNILSESGLKTLGQYAIEDCTALETVVLPDQLESIEKGVFWECSALKSVNMPKGLKYLASEVFDNLPLLGNELVLPEGLLWIGDFAFNHCLAIPNTKLTIPASVTQLGGDSYTGEHTAQGTHLFYDCATQSLAEYAVADGSAAYCAEDGVLYNADKSMLIAYPPMKADTDYEMPDTVTKMGELCFSRNQLLKNLILSDNYQMTTELPGNFLNNASNLGVALYLYTGIENIICKESNPNYQSTEGMLLSKDGTILYYIPTQNGGTGSIAIPEGVTTVYRGALYGNNYTAAALHIPASLVTIEADTFSYFNDNAWTLSVDENNPAYTLDASGKLVVKSA